MIATIIDSFIQNDKKYVYVLKNGKIKFGYKENNKIKYDLNDKEIDFMKFKISMLKCELKTELINGINFLFFLLLSINIISNHFPYSNKLMTYAIKKNDDLTEDEKDFLLSKLYILEENKEYIDTLEVYDNLTNLDIQYAVTPDQYSKENHCSGYYASVDDKMVINNTDSFENVINDYELSMTLLHETFHCFSNYPYFSGLNEAVVEVMANEYNGELKLNKCTYQDEIIIFNILSEIIGIEPFKNLTLKGDMGSITNELYNIIPDKNLANQLIKNIDSLSVLRKENNVEEYETTKTKIYEIIGQYFEVKYGYKMEQDEIIMIYFSYGNFISKDMDGYRYIYDIYPKGAFSKEYVEEHQNLTYITVDIEEILNYDEEFERNLNIYENDTVYSTLPKDGDIRLVFDETEDKIYIVHMCQNVIETKRKTFELHKFL